MKLVNKLSGQNVESLNVKPGGIYRNNLALNCYTEMERIFL